MDYQAPDATGFWHGLAAGSRVAGYRLEEQIGHGGMAVVFCAQDERLRRRVALKILSPALAADESFRQRFIRESRSAAAVDHPHIIPVYEAGDAGGVLFLAMRYVPDGDAGTLARRFGPLPRARVAAIISAVASALDAAHAAGLVHRDVKPTNMLVDVRPGQPDHVYLSDFGLTKGAQTSAALTATGHFLGTVDYSAPEQIEGRRVDARTDEYALACAAFELLAGTPPFPRDQGMAVLYAHLSAAPPLLTAQRPDLPPTVDEVLVRALAKAPEKRYASCGEFAAAFGTALGLRSPGLGYGPAGAGGLGGLSGAAGLGGPVGLGGHPPTEVPWVINQDFRPTADAIPPQAAATGPGVVTGSRSPGAAGAPETGTAGAAAAAGAAARGPARAGRPTRRGALAASVVAALAAGGAAAAVILASHSGQGPLPPASPGTTTRPPGAAARVAPDASGSASATSPGTAQATLPGISAPPADIWIAQLASVKVSAGSAQLQRALAQIESEIPGAQYLDSSDYASLNPGFWVVYYAGSFRDGNRALRYCAAHGRTTKNECIGRFLSHDIRDKSYICLPPAGSQVTGCFHAATTAFLISPGRDRPEPALLPCATSRRPGENSAGVMARLGWRRR